MNRQRVKTKDFESPSLSWTFSLWLVMQRKRKDSIGALARRVARDMAWPGQRNVDGLEEYMREQGADAETLKLLRRAYEEWKRTRAEH